MADLNALIAQGYQFQAPPDPFAQYAKMQQLDQGEQANQLNRMKMQEYQRGMEETNAMRRLDPTSATYLQDITRINPEKGFAFAKMQQEAGTARTEGDIKRTKLLADKLAMLPDAYRMADTPEAYLQLHESIHADPVIGPYLKSVGATPDKGRAAIQQAVETGKFDELRRGSMQSVSQLLESMKPLVMGASSSVYSPQTGAFTQAPAAPAAATEVKKLLAERDALPLGDPKRKIYDQQIKDLGSTAQVARDRLAFDQQKFTWEKANPGHELIQNADGEYYAVDKRTRELTPLMIGGATAAATPAGGGQGARGVAPAGGVPVGRTAPAAGVPFVGKSAALTESQGNAALFGSGMAQAQNVLTKASSKGVDTAPVTTSIVQGIVKYVPFGVGDKLVQDVMSVAQQDPTKFFGPDVEQQKVGQAQLAFAISYLRKTSGAAFGQSELVNTMNEFFPSVGEDKAVITQKAKARERVVEGMKLGAGSQGGKFIKQYQEEDSGTSASSANDPLGLRK